MAGAGTGLPVLTRELESKSAGGEFCDGLAAAGKARGARRADPRCPDITLMCASARICVTDKIITELEAGRVS
jgi:hypothetical protein